MYPSEFLLANNRNDCNQRILDSLQNYIGLETQNQRPRLFSQEQCPRPCTFGLVSPPLPLSTRCYPFHCQRYKTLGVAALELDIATTAMSKGKNLMGGNSKSYMSV